MVTLGGLIWAEVHNSWLQAKIFGAVMRNSAWKVEAGANPAAYFPKGGPYDERMGYSRLPLFTASLQKNGYDVAAQARGSKLVRRMFGIQVSPAYREKAQAGLRITDDREGAVFSTIYPQRIYTSFESIPPLVVHSLLFVENRELLDPGTPFRNPAIEWDRFANALIGYGLKKVRLGSERSGGSTLATQLEKLRHSPNGVTASPGEKLRQMLSASLKSYQDGENTLDARKRIVLDYVNSLPLASKANYGEVTGLGDGLTQWFGTDFDRANELLRSPEHKISDPDFDKWVRAYRETLSLIMAVRKPTGYLVSDRESLHKRVDGYLMLLANEGIISNRLRDEALRVRPVFHERQPRPGGGEVPEKKTADSLRVDLLKALKVNGLYELDRLDVSVRTTVDGRASDSASAILENLTDPEVAIRSGLMGEKLLTPSNAEGVIYSFSLYEKSNGKNLLRIQTDNYEGALNINEGTKLELGSTAKLRTLISYLETVADLYEKYSKYSPMEAKGLGASSEDRLSQWALEYLASTEERNLTAMLEASMERKYSGSPGEGFFTGGGLHYFNNFDPNDNGRMVTVRDGFHRSVNLVFVRIMRDIVNYHLFDKVGVDPALFEDPENPARKEYVAKFAEQESKLYLRRFYQRHHGKADDAVLESLASRSRRRRVPLAVLYRSVRPEATLEQFQSFMESACRECDLSTAETLYDKYRIEAFNLNDRGYLASLHPLELWVANYLHKNPKATFTEIIQESEDERQEVYKWLFRPRKKRAQDLRIRTLIEKEAFEHLHKSWKKLGFPFATLVPSYASALGSSGDTPAALAELAGIIANNGVRQPTVRFKEIHFAQTTPFETVFEPKKSKPEQVLAPEVVQIVKLAMRGVVERGTAGRAANSVTLSDGTVLPLGGKTGTGDNRIEMHTSQGWLKSSRAVSRTATFVFLIDDRFFGTVVAYVPGAGAASHSFTSALPLQVFRTLVPSFRPMLDQAFKPKPLRAELGQPRTPERRP